MLVPDTIKLLVVEFRAGVNVWNECPDLNNCGEHYHAGNPRQGLCPFLLETTEVRIVLFALLDLLGFLLALVNIFSVESFEADDMSEAFKRKRHPVTPWIYYLLGT